MDFGGHKIFPLEGADAISKPCSDFAPCRKVRLDLASLSAHWR